MGKEVTHNVCLKEVKLRMLSFHSEWIELLSVWGSFGPKLREEEQIPRTQELKKKKKNKMQPSRGEFPQGNESLYDLL